MEKKLENAKAAIIQVIKCLDDTDVLHLITYDSTVAVQFEDKQFAASASFHSLEAAVNQVRGGSCTNLWGGLEKGVQVLDSHKRQGFNHRVFLFSDGLVNEGLQDKPQILRKVSDVYEKHNFQVSAFGLGDDFDEELMKGIADKGIGAYFFIDQASTIPSFVDFALKSLQMTVGVGAVFKARGVNSGIVKKFYGDYDVIKGAVLGDLRGDNTRTILLQAQVSPPRNETSQQTETTVLECELTYSREVDKVKTDYSIKANVTLSLTENEKVVAEHKNQEVYVNTILQKIVKHDKKLAEVMETDRDEALKILNTEISLLESIESTDTNLLNGANKVAQLLKQTKENLEKFKAEGATKQQLKEVHHRGYTVTRG